MRYCKREKKGKVKDRCKGNGFFFADFMAVRLVRSKKRLIMKDGEVAISGFAFKTPPVRLGSRLGQHLLKNLGRISGAVASKTCAHEMPSSRYLRGDPVARKKKERKKPRGIGFGFFLRHFFSFNSAGDG